MSLPKRRIQKKTRPILLTKWEPGRIKVLLLRRHSDWFGDRFGELRLPQRSSTAGAAIEHAAIDLFIWICVLQRYLLQRRHTAIAARAPQLECFYTVPVGPTVTRPVQDTLAVTRLENRL